LGVTVTVHGVAAFTAPALFDPKGNNDSTRSAKTESEIRNAKLPATYRRELPPAEQGVSVKRNTP
jgi:hypothetical protein